MCTCGRAKQTAEHLFIRCPDMRLARSELIRELNHTDLRTLLTYDGAVASAWAVNHFDTTQFASARGEFRPENVRKHPHSLVEGT